MYLVLLWLKDKLWSSVRIMVNSMAINIISYNLKPSHWGVQTVLIQSTWLAHSIMCHFWSFSHNTNTSLGRQLHWAIYTAMVYRQQFNLGLPTWCAVRAETGLWPLSQAPATVNRSFLCKGYLNKLKSAVIPVHVPLPVVVPYWFVCFDFMWI